MVITTHSVLVAHAMCKDPVLAVGQNPNPPGCARRLEQWGCTGEGMAEGQWQRLWRLGAQKATGSSRNVSHCLLMPV